MPDALPIRPAADATPLPDDERYRAGMSLERAREINRVLTGVTFASYGLAEAPSIAELRGVSLAEMLESKALVRAANLIKDADGKQTITMTCDDRLIAAIYVLINYEPRSEAIVEIGDIGVAVLPLAKEPADEA